MGSYTRTYALSDGTTAYGSQVAFELDALGSSVNNIVNSQISSGAAIADSKLAQITTPSKVSGAAITLLTSLPSGAGLIPEANITALTGSVVQVVNTETGAYATGSTVIPYDDTIPQNTEGDQYMTLAITPLSATNKLKITVVVNANWYGRQATVALFQDSTVNALAVGTGGDYGTVGFMGCITFVHFMTAGTTSSTTFKVRAGVDSTQAFYFNGSGTGTARKFGGVSASSITIEEIKA